MQFEKLLHCMNIGYVKLNRECLAITMIFFVERGHSPFPDEPTSPIEQIGGESRKSSSSSSPEPSADISPTNSINFPFLSSGKGDDAVRESIDDCTLTNPAGSGKRKQRRYR